jgi:putative flippase GtrA
MSGNRAAEAWKFAKGQVSAGAATFVDWAAVSSSIWLGLHYLLAVPLGHVLGGLTDFAIKRTWVFHARAGRVQGQAWRYAVASLSSLAWNELLSWAAVGGLGLPKIPGVIGAAIFVGVAWNYPMHRLFVFRRPAEQSSTEG